MKILVTGASGFVARHLIPELLSHGHEVELIAQEEGMIIYEGQNLPIVGVDLTSYEDVCRVISTLDFEAVVHLAGIAHLVVADSNRNSLVDVNVIGTKNICAAVQSRQKKSLMLMVSSTVVYGKPLRENTLFNESHLPKPVNAYGFSKLAAENVAQCYSTSEFEVYIARPSNHIGPGQSPNFVCPSLAQRILNADAHSQIEVGNIASERDFSDVRDIVRAYRLIVEQKPVEKVFVLGRGKTHSIEELLSFFVDYANKAIKFVETAALKREGEVQRLGVDPDLAQRVLGWECQIPLEKSLADIYDSVRSTNCG